jgi:hypothetical protein
MATIQVRARPPLLQPPKRDPAPERRAARALTRA